MTPTISFPQTRPPTLLDLKTTIEDLIRYHGCDWADPVHLTIPAYDSAHTHPLAVIAITLGNNSTTARTILLA